MVHNPDAGRIYKVYRVLLNQTGTDPPVATVLENDIGIFAWTRDDAGQYLIEFPSSIVFEKTSFFVGPGLAINLPDLTIIQLGYSDSTHMRLCTWLSGSLLDDMLFWTPLEIQIDP